MLPSKGAIPVANVFDVIFYVSSGLSNDGVVGQHFMPAWLVQSADDGDSDKVNMALNNRIIKVPFIYRKTFLSSQETINVEMKLFYLTCRTDSYHQKDVTLMRDLIPDMITEVDPGIAAKFKAAKSLIKDARNLSKGASACDKEWKKSAKHLFK